MMMRHSPQPPSSLTLITWAFRPIILVILFVMLLFIVGCGASKQVPIDKVESRVESGECDTLTVKKPIIEQIKDIIEIRQTEKTKRVKERQETKRAKSEDKKVAKVVKQEEKTNQVEAKEKRKTDNVEKRNDTRKEKVVIRQENKGKVNATWWVILAIVLVISVTFIISKFK